MAAVGLLVAAVLTEGPSLLDALGRLDPLSVAAATGAVLVGLVATMLSWRALMAGLGSPLPLAAGARVYFLAQLGKYLPGSVWPVLAQMELGREYRVPPARSAAGAGLNLALNLVTGIVIGAAGLALAGARGLSGYWWVLLPLPALLALLHPRLVSWWAGLALRLLRRPPLRTRLGGRALAVATGWSALMWLALGTHVAVLAHGTGFRGRDLLLLSTGAYAVSWVAGFLVVVAPAGAGPRELALVVLLSQALPQSAALAVALVSRLLSTLCDLAVAGGGMVAERVHRARAPDPVTVAGARAGPDGMP